MELRVVRHTDRFDDGCRFYGDLLGWPVTHQWPAGDGQGRGRIFGYGETARVELIEVPAGSATPVTGVFVSAEVSDTAALHAALLDRGLEPSPLIDTAWGHRSFQVIDPTGVAVTLFQRL